MSGWYAMKRGWLDHEVFEPEGRWSRAEAWVWMVEAAAYKPTTIDLGGKPHVVPRGALCFSLRFLGKRWRWSTKAVQTFLRDLEAHGVVRSEVIRGGHGGETRRTQVTLCNYEKYQSVGNAGETRGKRAGNEEEQGNKDNTLEAIASNGAGAPTTIEVSVTSSAVWNAGKPFLASKGVDNPGAMIGRWLKTHSPLEVLAALESAQKSGTQDPVPYITEALKGGQHGKPSKSRAQLDAFLAGARRTS